MTHTRHNTHIHRNYSDRDQATGSRHVGVNGWDKSTRTVYQFYGCFVLGHNYSHIRGLGMNPVDDKPFAELKQSADKMTAYLRDCDWKVEVQTANAEKKTTHRTLPPKLPFPSPLQTQPIPSWQHHRASDHLREHLSDLQPVFKKVIVGGEDAGNSIGVYA